MSDNFFNAKDEANNNTKPALTPHELFNHHLQNPDEPITDDDIRNLKLDSGAVSKEHQIQDFNIISPSAKGFGKEEDVQVNEEADNHPTNNTETPFDILGG